jgi:RNA polymerase sigma-70 factor, ECF subfamily
MPGADRDERALVDACLGGDQGACTALVEAYARMVGTVIWRATGQRDFIEDLTQETFLRTFKALRYFDSRARLSTWIYTIAHNVAVDHLRRTAQIEVHSLTWGPDEADGREANEPASDTPGPEELLSRAEAEALVNAGLARLPVKYRLPVVYAAIDGLDYPAIARMLSVPLGTTKTLIFRGKRMLRAEIEHMLRERRGV